MELKVCRNYKNLATVHNSIKAGKPGKWEQKKDPSARKIRIIT